VRRFNGDNDLFRIRIGGFASNVGWIEIAAADIQRRFM
jgi:hypothetical protein